MAYKYWTEAEKTELKRLVGEGKTSNEIATALGRTSTSVNAQKKILGISNPDLQQKWTDTEITQLKNLISKGKTGYEIAEVLGRTRKSVYVMKQKLGLCKPTPSYDYWSEWELHKLRRYCKRGYPLHRICAYFPNRTRSMLQDRIYKMTRFWMTPEQKEERRLLKKREWQLRVW